MTVMMLAHRERRAHLPREQMQIGATVHDLKCLIQRRLYKVRVLTMHDRAAGARFHLLAATFDASIH